MDNIHTGSAPAFIRWDPERTDLTVTEGELERIGSASHNHWKDLFLVCLPLSISCILNAASSTPKPFTLTLALFLNYVIGVIALFLSIAFGLAWRRTSVNLKHLLSAIKAKPRYKVELSQTGSEGVPAIVLGHDNGAV